MTQWTDATYIASSNLIRDISNRWQIPLDRDHLVGHHEIFAKKTCPGFKVDLNKLIALAANPAATPGDPALVGPAPQKTAQPGTGTSTVRLNLRVSPDRGQAPVDTVDAGTRLPFDGFTDQGESINGNSKWFFTAAGEWFWSGGVR